jgi:SOS response regulatory protein OraA/RecX
MSERRGRGKPQGDPSWGDAIWIEAPSVKAARERAARGGTSADGAGGGAAGTDLPDEELPDGVDPERLAAARARSTARRARAQAEREHVVGSGPLEPRRGRREPRESPWAKAFGAAPAEDENSEDPAAEADGTASGWSAVGTEESAGRGWGDLPDTDAADDGSASNAGGARRGAGRGRRGKDAKAGKGSRGRGRGGRRDPAPLPSDPDELRDLARNIVLRHLTGAPRSRHQLEERLADRGIPEEVGAEVLDRMEAVRLVDDAAFAETLVRSRHRGRGLARSALRRELKEKGVDGETAEEALEAVTGEDERAAAEELVAKKIRTRPVPTGRDPESRAERDRHVRRLVAMLGRKGYAPGLAFCVVRDAIDAQDA